MSCQHLSCYRPVGTNWTVAHCAAKETPYVPSLFDLEGFCRSGRHALCPFYLLAGLKRQEFAGDHAGIALGVGDFSVASAVSLP